MTLKLGCIADDDDRRQLAQASIGLPLVVAGSGPAIGMPALHGLAPDSRTASLPPVCGARAVVSGGCSEATLTQVASFLAAGGEGFAIDPMQLAAGHDVVAEVLAWAQPRLGDAPVLVYATAPPDAVRAVQHQLGAEQAGALVEQALSRIAQGLVQAGVGQLIACRRPAPGVEVRQRRRQRPLQQGLPMAALTTARSATKAIRPSRRGRPAARADVKRSLPLVPQEN